MNNSVLSSEWKEFSLTEKHIADSKSRHEPDACLPN